MTIGASGDRERRPSPTGKAAKARQKGRKGPIFVIQRHQARSLHYDLRLERDGALASWAVPKGMPLEPGQQHLAVHVEDHPLEYGAFEGEIPKGEYGAGTVEIWDRGTYELLEEKKDGGLTFRLDGERLQGTWALIPAHLSGQEKNWLVLRKRDEAAKASTSGGTRRYRPMLATPVKELPRGEGWLFEPKWDGYRALAYLRGGEVELQSRTGSTDLTKRFDAIARALPRAVRTPDCVLDGEVCADRRHGPRELLGDAAGIRDARLLRLRPARAGRRAARRPAADGAPPPPEEAPRTLEVGHLHGHVRRRGRAARRRRPAGPGGRHGQAAGLPLRAGPVAPVAEGEGASAAGARRRRLHEGPEEARAHGRARARCPRAGRPALGRQRRHRLHGG